MRRKKTFILSRLLCGLFCFAGVAYAAENPNILFIMGDDIDITNISAYGHGVMGYQAPNTDRIAKEDSMFTDYYCEQSCTAGNCQTSI